MAFEFGNVVGNVVGGLFGLEGANQAEDAAAQRNQAQIDFAREQQQVNIAMQREFAQNGVRWRVEDAQAAGLHPLFALGGAGAAFSPSASSLSFDSSGSQAKAQAMSQMGQSVGRAISAQETEDQRALRMAVLKGHEAAANRDDAQAAYYRSLAVREAGNPAFPFGNDVVTGSYGEAVASPVSADGRGVRLESHPLYADAVKLKPDEMSSRDAMRDGQTAGRDHPGMRQFVLPGDFRVMLPATGGGGVPEEIDASMLPMVIGANLERYGWRWLIDAMGYATGQSPEFRRKRGSVESWYRDNVQNRFSVPGNNPKDRQLK